MTDLEDRVTSAFAAWAGGTPPLARVQEFIEQLKPVGLELVQVAAVELDEPDEEVDPIDPDE